MLNNNILHIFKKNKKTILILILVIFILISGAIYWLFYFQNSSSDIPLVKSDNTNNQKEEISPEIKQFGIKIDKIDVLTPVIKDVEGNKKDVYMEELKKGVAHYKGTALPGENPPDSKAGNIFIFGHSSAVVGQGDYSKIFARLGELEEEDKIVVYYQDEEIEYTVFEKKIVEKDDLSVLKPTEKEQLTLMTCWPIRSNEKRLIIKSSPK